MAKAKPKGNPFAKSKMAGKKCPKCGEKLDDKGYCAKCKKQY